MCRHKKATPQVNAATRREVTANLSPNMETISGLHLHLLKQLFEAHLCWRTANTKITVMNFVRQ